MRGKAAKLRLICGCFPFLLVVLLAGQPSAAPHAKCDWEYADIIGTKGPDVIEATDERDVIAGLGGDDIIRAYGDNDHVCGHRGDDVIYGGDGNDTIYGDRAREGY